jgi:hypothetical protein
MAGKGIQELSLLATHLVQDYQHLVQDAQQTGQPLRLISLGIEKAFDRLSFAIILQALQAFGFPELLIQALQNYFLIGYAKIRSMVGKGYSSRSNLDLDSGTPFPASSS